MTLYGEFVFTHQQIKLDDPERSFIGWMNQENDSKFKSGLQKLIADSFHRISYEKLVERMARSHSLKEILTCHHGD